VQNALLAVPGVRTVDVEFFAKEAYVTFDPAKTSPEAMVAALAKTGKYGGSFKDWGIPKRKAILRAPSIDPEAAKPPGETHGKPPQVYDPAFLPPDGALH
jgi:copper chaperone CopZ